MTTKNLVAMKPKLVSSKEMQKLKKKFGSLRTTVSTYTTHWGTVCTLYTFRQKSEKAGQFHDYGYDSVLKDFIHMVYYTTNEKWVNS